MPRTALKYVRVDYCVRLNEMPDLLNQLARQPAGEGGIAVSEETKIEVDIAKENTALSAGVLRLGQPSNYACPECHGVLLQLREGDRTRFRCHTGHAYSAESLLAEIKQCTEEALWNSIRSIEESELLLAQLAKQQAEEGNPAAAAELAEQAHAAARRGEVVRGALGVRSPT
jgi:two-component system chemotaxis response regulator CheB